MRFGGSFFIIILDELSFYIFENFTSNKILNSTDNFKHYTYTHTHTNTQLQLIII